MTVSLLPEGAPSARRARSISTWGVPGLRHLLRPSGPASSSALAPIVHTPASPIWGGPVLKDGHCAPSTGGRPALPPRPFVVCRGVAPGGGAGHRLPVPRRSKSFVPPLSQGRYRLPSRRPRHRPDSKITDKEPTRRGRGTPLGLLAQPRGHDGRPPAGVDRLVTVDGGACRPWRQNIQRQRRRKCRGAKDRGTRDWPGVSTSTFWQFAGDDYFQHAFGLRLVAGPLPRQERPPRASEAGPWSFINEGGWARRFFMAGENPIGKKRLKGSRPGRRMVSWERIVGRSVADVPSQQGARRRPTGNTRSIYLGLRQSTGHGRPCAPGTFHTRGAGTSADPRALVPVLRNVRHQARRHRGPPTRVRNHGTRSPSTTRPGKAPLRHLCSSAVFARQSAPRASPPSAIYGVMSYSVGAADPARLGHPDGPWCAQGRLALGGAGPSRRPSFSPAAGRGGVRAGPSLGGVEPPGSPAALSGPPFTRSKAVDPPTLRRRRRAGPWRSPRLACLECRRSGGWDRGVDLMIAAAAGLRP